MEKNLLKFEGRFKVGDHLRAFDFEPREGHGPCYIEGHVVSFRDTDEGGSNYKAIVLKIVKDVFKGEAEPGRVGRLVYVPTEIADHDYDGRIVLLTPKGNPVKTRHFECCIKAFHTSLFLVQELQELLKYSDDPLFMDAVLQEIPKAVAIQNRLKQLTDILEQQQEPKEHINV